MLKINNNFHCGGEKKEHSITWKKGKVNVIKVIKTVKTKADFEAIKSKYKMSFFTGTYNPFGELHSIRQLRITLWRARGVLGLASHVKDFSLLAHILWMKKILVLCDLCGRRKIGENEKRK